MKSSVDDMGEIERFKFLEFVLQKNGGFEEDIIYRIMCG